MAWTKIAVVGTVLGAVVGALAAFAAVRLARTAQHEYQLKLLDRAERGLPFPQTPSAAGLPASATTVAALADRPPPPRQPPTPPPRPASPAAHLPPPSRASSPPAPPSSLPTPGSASGCRRARRRGLKG
ncbi:hypothetical protein N0V90_002016 [Kalmusia sp. IMI 367209]|nr:hypothetical protein N0V90_002016 [Kalmusia sp. IMI 367209]